MTAGRDESCGRPPVGRPSTALTVCAIGEALGMVIGTSLGLSDSATVALAFVLGDALTVRVVRRGGLAPRRAVAIVVTLPVNRALMSRGQGAHRRQRHA